MSLTNSFNTSSSALTAQRLRMDIISSNIANAETTRGKLVDGEWVPYQRKVVVTEAAGQPSFDKVFQSKLSSNLVGNGVKVTQITEDQSPFKRLYQPTHPDANKEGFVYMPNVDILKEMVDMISATRSYEANVTALNASKSMFMKALEIGR
ncbi:flagellar basal body rod protein FlgC [Chengkuizengella sp. SCS-71B]|uniref:flagellar basal body rod protein FlgC n=1 Tax=Chengkuizengella sp. SCS-71B TaxID=3115290 RepID=UPI0032C24B0D